jgi:integrase
MKRRQQKKPFTTGQIETLVHFLTNDTRDNALRDLTLLRVGLDTMLRASDLLAITVQDVTFNNKVIDVFSVPQRKTQSVVTCVLTEPTRKIVARYISEFGIKGRLFPITERRYFNIVREWCELLRVDPRLYGTHSLRRTKASHIYAQTHNVRLVQQLLGHSSITHTQEYLGVELDDALNIAKNTMI